MLGMTEFSSNCRSLLQGRQDERRMSTLLYLGVVLDWLLYSRNKDIYGKGDKDSVFNGAPTTVYQEGHKNAQVADNGYANSRL